ncbi:MAG: M1 family aminopeptidase [Rhodospirillaceae bacterium]
MASMRPISIALAAALAVASMLWPSSLRAAVVEEVVVTLVPAESLLVGEARLSVPAGASDLRLDLDDAFRITAIDVAGSPLEPPRDPGGVRFNLPGEGPWSVKVNWRGALTPPGPPALSDGGSYVPGDAAWYPRSGTEPPQSIVVRTPPGQRAVLTGELVTEQVGADGATAAFAPYPDEPPSLFAGPYEVAERMVGDLRLRTYFPAEAAGLADAYLDDTARHIARFAQLIGPYPYAGFAVVAAPYPVGYGFPGLTYVSEKILALPFMRARSLPHEILHTWWGNSVTPDYASGNWAEGLTTYMADYGLASEDDQRRMRLTWMRDFAALPESAAKPVATFTSKEHGADQVIGYNKAGFIFHMLHQRLGPERFHSALGRVYSSHRGRTASWADLRAAFEAESGADLGTFFDQWLTRPDAPRLTLEAAKAEGNAVTLVLTQDGPPYSLSLPIVVTTDAGEETHVVTVTGSRATLAVEALAPVRAVAIDPEHHVFRRLSPEETPPILRDISLGGTPMAMLPDHNPEARAAAQRLVDRLNGGPVSSLTAQGAAAGSGPLMVVTVGDDTAALDALDIAAPPPEEQGTAYVWSWRLPDGRPLLVIQADDADALRALIRPLPHYGQDSWLVFKGSQMIDRGMWDPPAEPLRREFSGR